MSKTEVIEVEMPVCRLPISAIADCLDISDCLDDAIRETDEKKS